MIKTDIIKTYIFEPNYYEYGIKYIYEEFLKIFNNNKMLYIYIEIYNDTYCKTKQIKQNYIITFYFNYISNNIIISKLKNYDNTKIYIYNNNDLDNIFNYDLKITNNFIEKKIDKDIYIIYYHKKNIIKDINIKAISNHAFFNSNYFYYKYYINYYINYYIIIYNDIKKNVINKSLNCNTIFCNFSRNFMLFI